MLYLYDLQERFRYCFLLLSFISDKKLVEDINQCLADGGHEDSVELLQTKNLEGAEGEKRALIVWDLFKRMRAKGYDDAKLRK